MGVCTALVSDSTKTWFDLGKIFFDDDVVVNLKTIGSRAALEKLIFAALRDTDFNVPSSQIEYDVQAANRIATWMRSHPDWRFLTDQDEEFDELYLAEDEGDAEEYREEYGDGNLLVYMKDGVIED